MCGSPCQTSPHLPVPSACMNLQESHRAQSAHNAQNVGQMQRSALRLQHLLLDVDMFFTGDHSSGMCETAAQSSCQSTAKHLQQYNLIINASSGLLQQSNMSTTHLHILIAISVPHAAATMLWVCCLHCTGWCAKMRAADAAGRQRLTGKAVAFLCHGNVADALIIGVGTEVCSIGNVIEILNPVLCYHVPAAPLAQSMSACCCSILCTLPRYFAVFSKSLCT